MKVELDTNTLVRANPQTSPAGLACDLLLTIATGPHVLFLSQAILTEVQLLEAAGELVEVLLSSAVVVADPDDDPILQTAVSGHADVLCTRDSAFRHPLVEEVCRAQGIRILDDITPMHELRRRGEEAAGPGKSDGAETFSGFSYTRFLN